MKNTNNSLIIEQQQFDLQMVIDQIQNLGQSVMIANMVSL